MATQPFHQFQVTVAQYLKKRWNGANAYRLVDMHADLVQQCWLEDKLAEETAAIVDRAYMNRPQEPVSFPTMASMAAVGCKFHKA